jgi:hypothetical protein
MYQLLKRNTRQWLSVLCIAGFLLNIQASYACAMMPDMEQEQTNCCCGSSHRMDEMPDHSDNAGGNGDHSVLVEPSHSAPGLECNDPQMGCCMVEVSVGINDPPGDDDSTIASHAKVAPQKVSKQQDSSSPAVMFYDLERSFEIYNIVSRSEPLEPYIPYVTLPPYKSTERYRI